ncbi:phosphatidylinositol-specific phospholipase C/glycerophosphodiester phosphodiesterase family protein [Streptomyces europaeiscabiei]|uniref:phosphatidylinositol-specific phospholipase C/glycerophosphodiester phosphodiesterase family protein n=1 Tax=Streptomyces europaeiscabiei TaxID=146819 RepID=UPI000628649B|nr:phosphatidylinositol-specific phospholipase C/glycerophosphodiester phosphodiesterase family protein [Streptomyces europaeiscabiei]MDX2529180.1 phosphatidylinositol-specific phospholipase C/glycerophosphodiester phosphodiesterase family protein [Streptomyces europaeiscabiei]MDX2758893.1 phosphatidylinositol-specific phospholipase C/glycerophosphodiester phosphodiesterase family protein [Streptomyces europaeiscabiei]MDX3712140.1 phosphatidylinositol-specific phospholipase C/glycerophosphodiest
MALTTRRRALTTLGAALAGAVALPATSASAGERQHRPRPLWRAHAHNDYDHPRPLLDALDHRFGSVEADVFLVGDQLLVAHDPAGLDPTRTLESLYLDPLAARVRAHHGSVYRGYRRPLRLLIDIKTEGASTYLALDRHLRRHRHLFTTFAHGRVYPGAVTAVISGDRAARVPMEAQTVRRAFYDGRLTDLASAKPAPASFIPLISDNWTLNFTWQGVGPFPRAERAKLRTIVSTAHRRGQTVRFWATPDLAGPARDALWAELIAADVDHLNTDDLAGLEAFLDAHRSA